MSRKSCLIAAMLAGMFIFLSLHADSEKENQAEQAYFDGDYKQALTLYQEAIDAAPSDERARLMVEQAVVYYKDQHRKEAFQVYLQALEQTLPQCQEPTVAPEDRFFYEEGLKIALDPERSAREAGVEIRRRYAPKIALHDEYYLTNFLVASAYANLGMFEEFFSRFYHSYQQHPDSFLAYKAKAILHIKLYERARTPAEKEMERCAILENMDRALEKYPLDSSLYKLMVVFASDQQRSQVLKRSLQRIIQDNIVIPRRVVYFYVQSAVATNQLTLPQQFIDKAREWYHYSRSLVAAQQLVDRGKQ